MSQLPCTRVRCVGNAGYNSSFSVYVDCLRIAYALLLVSRGYTTQRDFYMPRGRFEATLKYAEVANIPTLGGWGGGKKKGGQGEELLLSCMKLC